MDFGHGRFRRRLIGLSGLAMGCGIGERNLANLQLDIDGAPLIDTDRIRVCIEGILVHETALGDGRLAIGGIPAETPVQVTISQLNGPNPGGGTNEMVLDQDQPWAMTPWVECKTECTPCSIDRSLTHNSRHGTGLMAIHFLD